MSKTYHTLVVNDSIHMRKLVVLALNKAGDFAITEVRDGTQALESLQKLRFDLIITDVHMPLVDGFLLVEKVREDSVHQNVPVLTISSPLPDNDRQRLMALGANELLFTPLSADAVISATRNLLNIHR